MALSRPILCKLQKGRRRAVPEPGKRQEVMPSQWKPCRMGCGDAYSHADPSEPAANQKARFGKVPNHSWLNVLFGTVGLAINSGFCFCIEITKLFVLENKNSNWSSQQEGEKLSEARELEKCSRLPH